MPAIPEICPEMSRALWSRDWHANFCKAGIAAINQMGFLTTPFKITTTKFHIIMIKLVDQLIFSLFLLFFIFSSNSGCS